MRQAAMTVAVLVATAALVHPAAVAAAAVEAKCHSPQPIAAPPGAKHPVVLVHGWMGKPGSMDAIREALEKGGRASVYAFDYHAYRNNWAADAVIADCLAVFIDTIAQASQRQPGKVFVVGHSMGGLATRYASQLSVQGRPVGPRIAGLVTLDTPHLGSYWGGTGYAHLLTSILGPHSWDEAPLPDPSKDGVVCLAHHDATASAPRGDSAAFPSQCGGLPPYLPQTAAVFQVSGQVYVERKFWGISLYRYSLDGDSVVDTSSELGYIGSGPPPANGTKVRYGPVEMTQVECTDNTDKIIDAASTLAGALGKQILSLTIKAVSLIGDNMIMDNVLSGTVGPAYAALLAVANFVTGCSHSKITGDVQTVKATTEKLTSWFDAIDNPMFAYTNPDGLTVVRGTKTAYRSNGEDCGALGNFYGDPVWTSDGRYVTSVWSKCEDDGLGPPHVDDNVLMTIDTRTGTKRQVTCGCPTVAAIEGSKVGWIDDRGRAYTLDLFGSNQPAAWPIRMPAGLYARQVLASADAAILVQASSRAAGNDGFAAQPDDQAGAVVSVSANGDVKVLQRYEQLVAATAAGGISTASGPQFVFGTIDAMGDCGHPGPVWLTDQSGNQKLKTDTSAIAKGGEVFLTDVWVSPQGQIMATLSSSICNPSGGTSATPASLWRLDGQKWVSVDRGPLAYVRQLSDSDKAVVISGDLYVERNGKGTRIAREVYAIATPPPA
ncbi:MAG TPA: alpha/beta fold hydrolase [Candidatus Limnocylindrales bacterium]|nr:alpha/beta fold hydrolase [Candidatus Limnocylindrales bacterium]